ncbi:hypothetical protein [Moheibacter sediminis]|uniref:WG containing repeat-containing protein n=1 Tax=Moheibacter sediminis TaxID=1434700 RepID=A0A1W1YDK9_9FLAO|nr:hypothetical protein [Moheibacter sediminis]SMC33891.1 hypothetical protein SAMN06296427_101265 [Moheibacter sediminis]
MKRIIFSSILIASNLCLNAQLLIGKETLNGASTLLDFGDAPDNTRGIILPAVTSTDDVSPANGNFVFDTHDNVVKVYENGLWKNLSEDGGTGNVISNPSADTGEGVIIGDVVSSVDGILVLESPNMAMILPKVAEPHLHVKSPYPGMMCYDTTNKALAVFDGSKWYYWN